MKDRVKNIQEWVTRLADKDSSVMDDINFLLDALQLTVNSLHNREIELEKAQEKIVELEETYTDIHGAIWEPPTSYAYAMICKAREKGRDRESILRDALENIYNATAKDSGLTVHEVTKIYCCARDALAYNEKPSTIIAPNAPANTAFTSLVNKFNQVI